jgi:hypothetical protein
LTIHFHLLLAHITRNYPQAFLPWRMYLHNDDTAAAAAAAHGDGTVDKGTQQQLLCPPIGS